jgi:hypothetical protein
MNTCYPFWHAAVFPIFIIPPKVFNSKKKKSKQKYGLPSNQPPGLAHIHKQSTEEKTKQILAAEITSESGKLPQSAQGAH